MCTNTYIFFSVAMFVQFENQKSCKNADESFCVAGNVYGFEETESCDTVIDTVIEDICRYEGNIENYINIELLPQMEKLNGLCGEHFVDPERRSETKIEDGTNGRHGSASVQQ